MAAAQQQSDQLRQRIGELEVTQVATRTERNQFQKASHAGRECASVIGSSPKRGGNKGVSRNRVK